MDIGARGGGRVAYRNEEGGSLDPGGMHFEAGEWIEQDLTCSSKRARMCEKL